MHTCMHTNKGVYSSCKEVRLTIDLLRRDGLLYTLDYFLAVRAAPINCTRARACLIDSFCLVSCLIDVMLFV